MDANVHAQRLGRYARFNPRARDGREHGLIATFNPAASFNPRARDGREGIRGIAGILPKLFQSTRP